MHYHKKSCILRQLKGGFSGDGKELTGLIKAEKYGQNLAVEISIINFAPLSQGEYYALFCDAFGKVEKLPLRGKCYFNLISDLDLSQGFCGVVCFVYGDVVPIACGINGDRRYDFSTILSKAFPPKDKPKKVVPAPVFTKNEPPRDETSEEKITLPSESAIGSAYDDEVLAEENYYEKESVHEPDLSKKSSQDVFSQSRSESKDEKTRVGLSTDEDDESVRHPFAVDGHGYYDAVQDEIRALFDNYPTDDSLKNAFQSSEWVRLKGEKDDPQYLVGVVYEEFLPKYICYAIAGKEGDDPPQELGDACTFVPISVFGDGKGFFVIFQSTATGECVRPTFA